MLQPVFKPLESRFLCFVGELIASARDQNHGDLPQDESLCCMAQLGGFIAPWSSSSIMRMRREQDRPSQAQPHGQGSFKEDMHPKNAWAGSKGLPPAGSQTPVVALGTSGGSGHPLACPAGLRACQCVCPQRHKAPSLWQSDGVINFRAIVLWWQALIYSPGNSFWFRVHIRCVNAP